MKLKTTMALLIFAFTFSTQQLTAKVTDDFEDALYCMRTKGKWKRKKCIKVLESTLIDLLKENSLLVENIKLDDPILISKKILKSIIRMQRCIKDTKVYFGNQFDDDAKRLKNNRAHLKQLIYNHYKLAGMTEWEDYLETKKKAKAQLACRNFEQALKFNKDKALDSLCRISRNSGTYRFYIEATPSKDSGLSKAQIKQIFRGIENKRDDFHKYYFEKSKHLANCEIYITIEDWGTTTKKNKQVHSYSKEIKDGYITKCVPSHEWVEEIDYEYVTETYYETKRNKDGTTKQVEKKRKVKKPVIRKKLESIQKQIRVPVYREVKARVTSTHFRQKATLKATAEIRSTDMNLDFNSSKFSTQYVNKGIQKTIRGDQRAVSDVVLRNTTKMKRSYTMESKVAEQFVRELVARYSLKDVF